jgi:hypothetical protein
MLNRVARDRVNHHPQNAKPKLHPPFRPWRYPGEQLRTFSEGIWAITSAGSLLTERDYIAIVTEGKYYCWSKSFFVVAVASA